MLRNDGYNFSRVGNFIERADSMARLLDVKYYVLLPSVSFVGSSLDNIQWETILRSTSAYSAYRWLYPGRASALGIADFLILDRRFPRSLAFCYGKLTDNLRHLAMSYGVQSDSLTEAERIYAGFASLTAASILEDGLHEFLVDFLAQNRKLAAPGDGQAPGRLRLPAAVRLEVRRGPEGPQVRRIFARGAEVVRGA